MDTVISVAETDPPTWDVSTTRGSLVVARIHQEPDNTFTIEPVGRPLDRINRGPYASQEDAVRAIEALTGGACIKPDDRD